MSEFYELQLSEEERRRMHGRTLLALVAKAEWEGTLTSLEAQEAAGRFARWVVEEGDMVIVHGPEIPHHLVRADVVSVSDEACVVERRGVSWAVPWGVVRVAWRHSDDHFKP